MTNTGKITLTVIFILLVFVGVSSYYFFSKENKSLVNNNKQMMTETSSKEDQKDVDTLVQDINTQSSGKYVEYSQDIDLSDSTKIVYFFFANWCPTCIPVDKEISENLSQIPEGLTIIRVNYNDTETDKFEQDLANKYEITYQHTFVLTDSGGSVLKKWNGGGLDKIIDNIN